jgi:hypothetical protein
VRQIDLEFRWTVAASGYRWVSWRELPVPPAASGPEKGFDFVLVENDEPDAAFNRSEYELFAGEPATDGLFKMFSEISPGDRAASVAFANRYGVLGRARPPHQVHGSRAVSHGGDLASDWDVWPYHFKTTINVWDQVRRRDVEGLANLFRWEPGGETGRGAAAWVFDTHREQTSRPPLAMRAQIFSFSTDRRLTEGADLIDVARSFLFQTVQDNVSLSETKLPFGPEAGSGRVRFSASPSDLVSAMWFQFGFALGEGQQFRKCKCAGCPEWFRVSDNGLKAKRLFCTDSCKMKDYRQHKKAVRQVKGKKSTTKRMGK